MDADDGIARLKRRRRILSALYHATRNNRVYSAAQLANEIGIDIDEIVFDLHVLNARNLVNYSWTFPAQPGDALVNLDGAGFELVESEERFSRSFPRLFTNTTIWPAAREQLGKGGSAMTLNELRRSVLEILYETFSTDPFAYVTGEALSGHYHVERRQLTPVIKFLEEEGYVKTEWFLGGDFITRITSRGVRLIEDQSEFNEKFPPVNSLNVYGDVLGAIQQGTQQSNLTNTVQFVPRDDIATMLKLIQELKNIPELSKVEELPDDIASIESELKKTQPRKAVLSSLIDGAKAYVNAASMAGAQVIGQDAIQKILHLLTLLGTHVR